VVERPASVLKELVENSLDAGADDIAVTLEDGGQTLLAVRDNGRGMAAEDLELAVTRHATSKVADFSDLLTVATYGFRGEALPSIGAVADLLVESVFAPDGDPLGESAREGAFIRLRHGEITGAGPSALPGGTLVEVRDLFANVPARLKFLKAPGTELKRCREILVRLALARPGTRFCLRVTGGGKARDVLTLDAGLSLAERLAQVWPPGAVEGLLPFSGERHGLRVHGLAAPPQFSQTRADSILLYVNKRPVNNRLLLLALREAYKGRLTSREHPQAVLFLDMDPREVDVNVHPAKSEVRFRDERAVFGAVKTALDALEAGHAPGSFPPAGAADGRAPVRPAGEVPRDLLPGLPPLYAPASARAGAGPDNRPARPAGFWGSLDAPRLVDFSFSGTGPDGPDEAEAPFARDLDPFAGTADPWSPPEAADGAGMERAPGEEQAGRAEEDARFRALPPLAATAGYLRESVAPFLPDSADSADSAGSADGADGADGTDEAGGAAGEPVFAGRPCRNNGYPVSVGPLLCLGQVADSYLILVQEESLLLLDQHAAHERVLLHLLQVRTQSAQSQLLALPADLPLQPSESRRLQELSPALARLGYSLTIGVDRAGVAGVPPLLGRSRGLAFLRDILAGRTDGIDDLLHLMACRSAVKAGQRLTGDEAAELLRQWLATPERHFCPHGRPAVLAFDPPALEKMFKR
jgi:DNA mismatch repair protein MutL